MMNDLLSDGITRLRNGSMRGLENVQLLNSKLVRGVLKILQEEGYIEGFREDKEKKMIDVNLKYFKGQPVLRNINRVSKCSRRIYSGAKEIPRPKFNFGIFILSTNMGIMTNVRSKKLNFGGEILLEVF
jgi:small subunit ribosomal protein S8